jgi:hypothetical protein
MRQAFSTRVMMNKYSLADIYIYIFRQDSAGICHVSWVAKEAKLYK